MNKYYRTLSRVYRPTHFEDIVAQQHVVNTLKNALNSNRIAHAYMFCGPRGIGKTTLARILARQLNKVGDDVDSESLSSSFYIIEIDAASNNSVDYIRNLRQTISIPPQAGYYKIYIIDEAHMLTKSAFNALLKTLEEPPSYIIFIFATTQSHSIPTTILSRVQRFDFQRITITDISNHIAKIAKKESLDVENGVCELIATKADGSLRDALGYLDLLIANINTPITLEQAQYLLKSISIETYFELTYTLVSEDVLKGLKIMQKIWMEGYDIGLFFQQFATHLRNILLAKYPDGNKLIDTRQNIKEQYDDLASKLEKDEILRMIYTMNETLVQINNTTNLQQLMEMTFFKLLHLKKIDTLEKVLQKIETLKHLPNHISKTQTTKQEEPLNKFQPKDIKNTPSSIEKINPSPATITAEGPLAKKNVLKNTPIEANIQDTSLKVEPLVLNKENVLKKWHEIIAHIEKTPTLGKNIANTLKQIDIDVEDPTIIMYGSSYQTALLTKYKKDLMQIFSNHIIGIKNINCHTSEKNEPTSQEQEYEIKLKELKQKNHLIEPIINTFDARLIME